MLHNINKPHIGYELLLFVYIKKPECYCNEISTENYVYNKHNIIHYYMIRFY